MTNLYVSGALVAHEPKVTQPCEALQILQPTQMSSLKIEEVVDDEEKVVLQLNDVEDEDFYSIEEMERLDNPTMTYMAKKFKNIRFKRDKPYKPQGPTSRFSKGSSSKAAGGATRGEEEEFVNLALMAKSDDESSSSSNQTSPLDSLAQENARLKNELVYAKEIEEFLRKEITENEFKIKAFRNSSKIVQDYNEKHTENQKVGVGFEYSRRPGKESVIHDCSKDVAVKPRILKKVDKTIFKISEFEFDKEAMLIKQQLLDENECVDNTSAEGKYTIENPKTVTLQNNLTKCSKDIVIKGKT
ncbi:hypothetical protein POM88_011925 [Heracleum sosnowskyi]|uniref:Uncharacterized protein n=1 Tax=Heracleum sosnowskyi TaxID=360622 RepID=A0AAD8N191_9APIA|nr:hypothetical protein POM88_011925 [Heracleum sosnowskyi]